MVGSTGSLISMRLIRSKLRKREESSSATPASIEAAQQTNFGPHSGSSSSSVGSIYSSQRQRIQSHVSTASESLVENNSADNMASGDSSSQQEISCTRTTGGEGASGVVVTSSSWVFPPRAPTPNIYNCNNNFDALIAANEKNGLKGFRKQFSGRFKRLVAKKPHEPAPAIPPELKPQLKTIYVY